MAGERWSVAVAKNNIIASIFFGYALFETFVNVGVEDSPVAVVGELR